MTDLPKLPVNDEEKALLHGLIEDMVNDDSEPPSAYSQFHHFIQTLQMKYGEVALLTAIKADFLDTEEPRDKIELYKTAIKLAEKSLDIAVITQSIGSIAELYIEELEDQENGALWIARYKEVICKYGDEYIVVQPAELEPKLKRLRIHIVAKPSD